MPIAFGANFPEYLQNSMGLQNPLLTARNVPQSNLSTSFTEPGSKSPLTTDGQ